MTQHDPDLTALIGSRICHDLISPLGAIGNGVELLQLSGLPDTPEMELIAQSVANANLRIRFFRVAFGAASDGQTISEAEIKSLIAPNADGRKIEIDWQPNGDQPRCAVKVAFLILQCFETSMPWGGRIQLHRNGDDWIIQGQADRLNPCPDLWTLLGNPSATTDVPPAQVHFALIAPELQKQNLRARVTQTENTIRVVF